MLLTRFSRESRDRLLRSQAMDHRQLLQFHAIDPVHADPDAEDLSFELGEFVREEWDLVHAVRLL